MKSLVVLLMLATAACAHHPGDCALGIMDWDDCLPGTAGYAKHQRALAMDGERCGSYGLAVGTPEYAACRENRDAARVERSQAVLGAVLGRVVRPTPAVLPVPTPPPIPVGGVTLASNGCERGHWIRSVADSGGVVILEDSSVWLIGSLDKITTMLWLPVTNVLACDGQLINLNSGETAQARRAR